MVSKDLQNALINFKGRYPSRIFGLPSHVCYYCGTVEFPAVIQIIIIQRSLVVFFSEFIQIYFHLHKRLVTFWKKRSNQTKLGCGENITFNS
jgi:hypothetical protein